MVRFRYGPWDERYRRWIGLLVARNLVTTYVRGHTVHVGLTERGRVVANVELARSRERVASTPQLLLPLQHMGSGSSTPNAAGVSL